MRRRKSFNSNASNQDNGDNQAKLLESDPADRYIKNCAQFELAVDSNVVIALRTRFEIYTMLKSNLWSNFALSQVEYSKAFK